MAMPVKKPGQGEGDPGQVGTNAKAAVSGRTPQPESAEESLGEQLIREARDGHAEFIAGWRNFMEELGIQGKPIDAKKLRETLLQKGFDPNNSEFSRGIIAMREE